MQINKYLIDDVNLIKLSACLQSEYFHNGERSVYCFQQIHEHVL